MLGRYCSRTVMLVKPFISHPILNHEMTGATSIHTASAALSGTSSNETEHNMICRPIVLSGPSGGGKSTILSRAMSEYSDSFAFSVSHTTRKPRPGEVHGVSYWFTDTKTIDEMIARGEFLEYAKFGGNTYGTSKKTVEDIEDSGKICVLDIELQGVRSIKASHLDAIYILIRAPSIDILEKRLKARNTETEDSIAKRLKHAEEDLEAVNADPTLFDHIIVNDDLEVAYKQFISVISPELNKTLVKKE